MRFHSILNTALVDWTDTGSPSTRLLSKFKSCNGPSSDELARHSKLTLL